MQIKGRRKVVLYDIAIDIIRAYVVLTMAIRMISKKDLRALVLYSPAHIDRLEKRATSQSEFSWALSSG